MTKYKVWISSGESPYHRTYFNELGAVQLSQEQVDKYFTFSPDGKIQFDEDEVSEATERDYDDPEADLPTWDTITDGCICWGPDAEDQYIGVSLEDDDENAIWSKLITTLPYYTSDEIENNLIVEEECDDGIVCINFQMEAPDGVWMLYNSYERGNYIGELELPDDEEFDPSKLVVNLTEVADAWTVVNSIEYNGEDIYCDGDTIGKGIDWYIYHNDNLQSFK